MIPADDALERLRAGNERYVRGADDRRVVVDAEHRLRTAVDPQPFAVVLGCADARVPAEIVFDQGIGDLFVVRVAGIVVMPTQLGSIEFAAERLGIRLVVVLGHTGCGAVRATLESIVRPPTGTTGHMSVITDRIRPALAGVDLDRFAIEPEPVLNDAVRRNIRASVGHVHADSEVLRRRIDERRLRVVGAEYAVATGEVRFLDDAVAG